jgi:hypothetical protein
MVIKSRRMGWAGHVACVVEMRNAYNILIGKTKGKRPLGKPKRRWKYNIRMDIREIGWEIVDWMHLAQDRDQWRSHVKAVIFGFNKRREFLTR